MAAASALTPTHYYAIHGQGYSPICLSPLRFIRRLPQKLPRLLRGLHCAGIYNREKNLPLAWAWACNAPRT